MTYSRPSSEKCPKRMASTPVALDEAVIGVVAFHDLEGSHHLLQVDDAADREPDDDEDRDPEEDRRVGPPELEPRGRRDLAGQVEDRPDDEDDDPARCPGVGGDIDDLAPGR